MSLGPALALIAITLGWFLLPLIPAILELVRPTDLAPLSVVPRDAGDVAFLAKGFKSYLRGQLDRLPAETPNDFLGRLPDGTHFARVKDGLAVLTAGPKQDRVVVLESDAAVPGDQTFLQEIHARGHLSGGGKAIYRAVLGDQRVTLGEGSRILRWIHAVGALEVGRGSALQGRASSARSVSLGRGVSFDRIGAPEITVPGSGPEPIPSGSRTRFIPPDGATRIGDHLRIDGDLTIPPDSDLETSLVVTGRLVIGRGTTILGSIKAHGAIQLDAGAEVRGSVVGRSDVSIGPGCFAVGPVIAEGAVTLGPGSIVGTAAAQTTVAADRVTLDRGTVVYGQITTRRGGETTSG